ncbi:MFS transporter [Archangium lansingense]|uniref:MFS transporter n=1 Tax=Archangium lansingense TaxID=2995310 RepID=UPI003B77950B
MTSTTVASAPAESSALRIAGYRTFLITFMLAMMADNIEHVISYWVAFQKFHSAALGGFAVVSHWLPFLVFSVPVGALNDRFDSRRLIQAGMVLFIIASLGWGYFFVTDSLQLWHAMVLLTIHGCAGVLWGTSSQMLLYDIVGPGHLPSAVRLNATARYLGVLVGPGVGSIIMQTLGPTRGIFVNTLFYLPLVFWLVSAPFGRHFRGATAGAKRAVRGISDIVQTIRDVRGMPVVGGMVLLAGAASFFIGNSYHAQMPGFAHDLGHGDPGMAYTVLLGADAAGALLAGILLETRGTWLPTAPSSALKIAFLWGCSLFTFSFMNSYAAAICVLFLAGFLELSFSSMTQALVQLNAPDTIRGRVLGLFSMSASGLRAFSGVTVGLLGSVTNTHVSLALSALAFVTVAGLLLLRRPPQGA